MIHYFPEGYTFEATEGFTNPFRYAPHSSVSMAARLVMERIESDPALASDFSEGKMLGVLVCRPSVISKSSHVISSKQNVSVISSGRQQAETSLCYLAAFSGNVGGRSIIDGFVPPIFDLTTPDGYFKKGEAEISTINKTISELTSSDKLAELKKAFETARSRKESEIENFKNAISKRKSVRAELRTSGISEEEQNRLILESQHEKAQLRRLRNTLQSEEDSARLALEEYLSQINKLKALRAQMSDKLQDWIFKQYIVHNAHGESSSIAEIFASSDLVPPGGTGECAAPKLLEYAYRNCLEPLAMGEFWYGRSPETAVRTHGHFYPSCTSKCGPLLGYMLGGMSISEWPMIPKTPAFTSFRHPLAGGGMSSPSSGHSDIEQTVQPIQIPEPITLYEDEAMIVVEKPSGMPSVPGLDRRVSLLEWLSSTHLTEPLSVIPSQDSSAISSEGNETRHLHVVHRLDMDTSGVMVFAKTHEAAVNLRRQFEEHSVQKIYMARVSAPLRITSGTKCAGTIDLPLSPDYDERPRQKVDFKQGKLAHTRYQIISENPDGTADLLLYPHTGRTHQLRVHCAHVLGLGRPILGDLLYGGHSIHTSIAPMCGSAPSATRPTRLYLHALSITFQHPQTGAPLAFTSRELCY